MGQSGVDAGWRFQSDAVGLLTVYLVLLLAVPSSVRIAVLGSLGRPSLLWGLILFSVWGLWRIQARSNVLVRVEQPVRLAYFALFVIALVSFAAALLRGQPADQVSPAFTSLLRLLSWGGPMLVAMDGIRTLDEVMTMVRRIAVAGGLLAAFGLLQFGTGQSWLGWLSSVPGLEVEEGGVALRGAFTRASGTSIHPLEHATALSAALPLAIAMAMHPGRDGARDGYLGWWSAFLITLGSVLAVSRSAIIGFGVAVIFTLPGLPKRLRALLIGVGVSISAVLVIAQPGLFTTMITLFAPGGDASTRSRTDALARVPEFISGSPLYGTGFGTFLPRYYIFDNAWVLVLVELGILGVLTFAALFITAVWSSVRASLITNDLQLRLTSRAVAASVLAIAVVFAFFDGLSFPIAAGLTFLLFGLGSAVRTVALVSRV
ncbi:MAG: O-antigen ligase family protein [Propionibacteriaceae bacterium]